MEFYFIRRISRHFQGLIKLIKNYSIRMIINKINSIKNHKILIYKKIKFQLQKLLDRFNLIKITII
jgi:hypothetical protein